MDKKKSEFDKVFSAWDILVIAFGAMIGWGWVVSSGDWIQRGGVLGAMIGFALGGVMIFFVGLTYAELTAAMPQCGGEHVFSYKAMGPIGSFICTWAIVLGYVSVVCFEACALPTIITYIYPGFLKGYLYTVAGFDIYASWLAVAILVAIFMTIINILGAKTAAVLQTVLTVIIGGVGLLLIASSVITGDVANLEPQLFVGDSASTVIKSVFSVMLHGLMELSDEFLIPQVPTTDGNWLYDVFFQLRLDHPEIFWAVGFKYRYYKDSPNLILIPEYIFDKNKIREHQKALGARVDKLVRTAMKFSEWDKEKYVHDVLPQRHKREQKK